MAGASGVTIGSAVSDQEAGAYSLVKTTATSGEGSGLTLNFVVADDTTISSDNFNIISRGVNYQVGDTFTIDGHGAGAVMSVAMTSASVEDYKHDRYYVKVQPNNQAGPPTFNLSDRDVEDTNGGGVPGPGPGLTALKILHNGVPVLNTADTINFIGNDIQVSSSGDIASVTIPDQTTYTFEGEDPIVAATNTDVANNEESVKVSLDIRLLGHR